MNLNPKLQPHAQCGAAGVRPQERPSSTDRRSARANDCGRRGRHETRWFGDPGTYELYSTCPIGRDAFISSVIPGRCNASNPESRDSGSGANAPSRNDGRALDCFAEPVIKLAKGETGGGDDDTRNYRSDNPAAASSSGRACCA